MMGNKKRFADLWYDGMHFYCQRRPSTSAFGFCFFSENITQLETHEVIKGSGKCVNAGRTILYEPGTIPIMQASVPHEVDVGSEGLYLFAKFMSALC